MKIAILFGAKSYEHEISIVSAIAMQKVLKQELLYIFCDKDRNFYHIPVDKLEASCITKGKYKKFDQLFIRRGGFYKKSLFSEKRIDFTILLNLVHGGDGEDGKLASILEFYDIDFIGPRVEASVISYNKLFTKMYAKELGIKVLEYQLISKDNRDIEIPFPFIVKPLRLGSSIGVTIVENRDEIDYALDVAFEFDNEVLIEPFIKGVKEYNLAGIYSDKFELSIIEEPKKEKFLDFNKKYMDFSRTKQILKADISEELEEKIKESFKKIYNTLFRGALIRCDFFEIDEEIYLNEINPIPGSMANYLFETFSSTLNSLYRHLPKPREIVIDYKYLHSIQSAKGK